MPQIVLTAIAFLSLTLPTVAPATADEPPTTGGVVSQTIELHEGINWIGLSVFPSERAMADVLASISEQLVLVKDSDGRHYFPEFGTDDLLEWEWDQGYIVKVSQPATLTVTGERITPGLAILDLSEGWSLVPFFGEQSLTPSVAFASLGSRLVEARDSEGRTYSLTEENPSLTEISPGRAYQVRLSEPATLVYTTDSGDLVANRAELVALPTSDLAPGATVTMAGYYTPGDGGGGVFTLVEEPGWGCDAGLVLCPRDQLSTEISDETIFTSSQSAQQFTVSQPPVAFGTLTLTLTAENAGGEPWLLSIPDAYMHGTTHQMRDEWRRTFDHETGQFRENRDPGGRPIGRYLSAHLGSAWSASANFTYRRVDGGLRWLRTHDEDGMALPAADQIWNARWFGCRSHDQAAYFDNTNCLNWTLILAKYTNQAHPGRVSEVRLTHNGSGPTTFYYSKSVQIPEGLALSGDAGARLVDDVDEFGNQFQTVRPRADAVTLKVLPESADGCASCTHVFDHLDMRRPYGDPYHRPPSPSVLLGNTSTSIQAETAVQRWSVRDLVLDGNKAGQDIWADRYSSSDRESYLRNSPGYTGIAQSIHGGKNVGNQQITIARSYITGYAGTGVLTSNHADTTHFVDVSIGDAAYNHAGYLQNFTNALNLGTHGEGWGHFEIASGHIVNLFAENLLPGRSGASGIFNWRGGDYDTVNDCPDARFCGTEVVGMYVDMEGSNRPRAMQGIGPGVSVHKAVILTRSDGDVAELWRENGNGYQSARYHGISFDDISFYVRNPSSGSFLMAIHNFNQSSISNISNFYNGEESDIWSSCINFRNSNRGTNTEIPFSVVYFGLGTSAAPLHCGRLGRASLPDNGHQHHYFILNSHIANRDHGVIRGSSGTGRLSSICEEDEVCDAIVRSQVYIGSTILEARGNRFGDGELFFELARFSNVTDPSNGATSEDSGTFTCSGGTVYERQTNLFWRPHATRGRFDVSGGPSVQSVEFVNEDGQTVGPSYLGFEERDARRPIARITFSAPCPAGTQVSWDAAVSEWLDENGQPVTIPDWYTNR